MKQQTNTLTPVKAIKAEAERKTRALFQKELDRILRQRIKQISAKIKGINL